jgi:VIT1/CCC1 family predicted Fe2+/Mn2+ transporter
VTGIYLAFFYFFPVPSLNPFYRYQVLNYLIIYPVTVGIVIVQIYRYRRVSSPIQRQQTKWVVYGISMGAVGWTSALSERDYYRAEQYRESAEIDAAPEAERAEIRDIYAAKGFVGDLLEQVVDTITANRDAWLATMMDEELHLQPVEAPDIFRSAIVITIATLIGHMIPCCPSSGCPHDRVDLAIALSALTLFSVGVYEAVSLVGAGARKDCRWRDQLGAAAIGFLGHLFPLAGLTDVARFPCHPGHALAWTAVMSACQRRPRGGGLRWHLLARTGTLPAARASSGRRVGGAASSSAGYRRVSSSMAMRPSSRASEAPRQWWVPREKARCRPGSGRSIRNSSGCSKTPGSRLAPPMSTRTTRPAAITVPPTSTSSVAVRAVSWTGLS